MTVHPVQEPTLDKDGGIASIGSMQMFHVSLDLLSCLWRFEALLKTAPLTAPVLSESYDSVSSSAVKTWGG